jgi:hypothetical protein
MLTTGPLAGGLFVRHYSELSDAKRVFLCRGLMPQGYRCARLGEPQSILAKNMDRSNLADSGNQRAPPLRLRRNRRIHHRVLLRFFITVETLDKERRLLPSIYLGQKPGTN